MDEKSKNWYGRAWYSKDLAYAAGLIDGEGCISACHAHGRIDNTGSYSVSLRIQMTDIRPLDFMFLKFGGRLCGPSFQKNPNNKASYDWSLHGKPLIKLLKAIMPYLKIKHERAKIALEFLPMLKSGRRITKEEAEMRAGLFLKLRRLNHRGTKEYSYNPTTDLIEKFGNV